MTEQTTCLCRCHAYGPRSHVTCDQGPEIPGGRSCVTLHSDEARSDGISPCAYPRCRDKDGNPRLTRTLFCEPCQRRYRRVLTWLVLDYVTLRTQLPMPITPQATVRSASKEYGHPREWASDTARIIAEQLSWVEDAVREEVGESPIEIGRSGELVRVRTAFAFLDRRFGDLLAYSAAVDTASEFEELHHKIRSALGQTRFVQLLPTPCPFCETAALVRSVGEINCGDCGRVIREEHYDWLTSFILDQLIKDYDARIAAKLA